MENIQRLHILKKFHFFDDVFMYLSILRDDEKLLLIDCFSEPVTNLRR